MSFLYASVPLQSRLQRINPATPNVSADTSGADNMIPQQPYALAYVDALDPTSVNKIWAMNTTNNRLLFLRSSEPGVGALASTLTLARSYSAWTALADAVYAVTATGTLYKISVPGIVETLVGTVTGIGTATQCAMSANPYGILFLVVTSAGPATNMYTLNPVTAVATFVATLTTTVPSGTLISSITFSATETLYGLAYTSSTVFSILVLIQQTAGVWGITQLGTPQLPGFTLYKGLYGLASVPPACIHKSSRVLCRSGVQIEISNLKPGESIALANGRFDRVQQVVPCGNQRRHALDSNHHVCLVFESDSISPGVPNSRFIVDPGHPICPPTDYARKGHLALKMARVWFLAAKPGTVQMTTWNKIPSAYTALETLISDHISDDGSQDSDLQPAEIDEKSRYDLVLESGESAFIANNVAVMSRHSFELAGYDHAGGLF